MKSTLADFLKYTVSQREVSLVISQNPEELAEHVKTLDKEGFVSVDNIQELFQAISQSFRIYFVAIDPPSDLLFEFICQYRAGLVHMGNFDNLKFVKPQYEGSSLVMVMPETTISQTLDSGKKILNQVGITYRSE